MIVANITSFEGQCADAEHYYCSYSRIDNFVPNKETQCCPIRNGEERLTRTLTASDAVYLNRKDSWSSWHEGDETERFDSIEDIHKALIELFVSTTNEDIITFYESGFFKEMLYYKDGENQGIEYFGEIWSYTPISCYKDLVPDLENRIIKCEECGHVHEHDDVYEISEHLDRELIKFYPKYDTFNRCCKYYALKWNFVL